MSTALSIRFGGGATTVDIAWHPASKHDPARFRVQVTTLGRRGETETHKFFLSEAEPYELARTLIHAAELAKAPIHVAVPDVATPTPKRKDSITDRAWQQHEEHRRAMEARA